MKVKLVGKSRRVAGELQEAGKPFDVNDADGRFLLKSKMAVKVEEKQQSKKAQ